MLPRDLRLRAAFRRLGLDLPLPEVRLRPKPEILAKANELKVIIGSEEDFAWAEENRLKVGKRCLLLLQPDWNRCNVIMSRLVNYVLENPKWRVSLQSHKYMQIL